MEWFSSCVCQIFMRQEDLAHLIKKQNQPTDTLKGIIFSALLKPLEIQNQIKKHSKTKNSNNNSCCVKPFQYMI